MILLDTHIWVWWVTGDPQLGEFKSKLLLENEESGLGVSIISCWEVAKKVEVGKLDLGMDARQWLDGALRYPGIDLLPLTVDIVLESTRLPQPFHRDPADQLIVATARMHQIPLVTADERLLIYRHVQVAGAR